MFRKALSDKEHGTASTLKFIDFTSKSSLFPPFFQRLAQISDGQHRGKKITDGLILIPQHSLIPYSKDTIKGKFLLSSATVLY